MFVLRFFQPANLVKFCFNCGSEYHVSQNCPLPPQWSRCPSCNKAVKNAQSHAPNCRTPFFKSEFIGGPSVFPIQKLAELKFLSIDNKITVLDGSRSIEINELPLHISTIDCVIQKSGNRSFQLLSSRHSKRSITIVNRRGEAVISIVFDSDCVTVNGRYQLRKNGYVSFHVDKLNTIVQPKLGLIQVLNNAEVFAMRLIVWDQIFEFDVYPSGPILVDAQMKYQRSLEQKKRTELQAIAATTQTNDESNDCVTPPKTLKGSDGAQQNVVVANSAQAIGGSNEAVANIFVTVDSSDGGKRNVIATSSTHDEAIAIAAIATTPKLLVTANSNDECQIAMVDVIPTGDSNIDLMDKTKSNVGTSSTPVDEAEVASTIPDGDSIPSSESLALMSPNQVQRIATIADRFSKH